MKKVFLFMVLLICAVFFHTANAQTTAFTYQGSLTDNGAPANGNFDFQFFLFASDSGGSPVGLGVSQSDVPVTNGIFTVIVNFGNQFPGAIRFLEIRVRQSGGSTFTTLAPRQPIASAPYSVKSLNSELLGGVQASNYVLTGDARLSDARTPLPNSPNYIQNSTSQQTSSNFNISGTGTANILSAATQFNIGNNRILSYQGFRNSFFAGVNAGIATTTGSDNSFFGTDAGRSNTTASENSFFGKSAGQSNTIAGSNSFFGYIAGAANTIGSENSFFGKEAGNANIDGFSNSFFGTGAGRSNTTGNNNSFFGKNAGNRNTTGSLLTLIGSEANVFQNNLTNATAIGYKAFVSQSNSLVLGSIFSINGASEDTNVGIGTTAPTERLHVVGNGFFNGNLTVGNPEPTNVSSFRLGVFGTNSSFIIARSTSNDIEALFGVDSSDTAGVTGSALYGAMTAHGIQFRTNNVARMVVSPTGDIGIGTTSPAAKLDVNGVIRVVSLGSAGTTSLCRSASFQIAACSSSIRYKTNINNFDSGLNLIRRLRPVSFDWKESGTRDLGLVAEEVAEVEPLLITKNDEGETEGVKYDRVGIVLVNAVNEQQMQIEALEKKVDEQKEIIQRQQVELNTLKQLVCSQNSQAEICKQPK